jgi:hypothetical protein
MSRETSTEKWNRLTRLARTASPSPADRDEELPALPLGTVARLASKWSAGSGTESSRFGLLERAAWCGAGVAIAICLAAKAAAPVVEESSQPLAFDAFLFAPDAPPDRGDPLF